MSPVLAINDLAISIKNRIIMQNVTFEISEGEAVLLSGSNGAGKSTLLKGILRLETDSKSVKGSIISPHYGDILSMSNEEIQHFRSNIAYVQQKDNYAEMGNIEVRDIVSESSAAYSGKSLNSAEVNNLIDEWIPRSNDSKRIFDAKSKPAKFSGGEQRLLSVLSVLCTRPNAELILIDEPLNNLDFINARNISNLINKVIKTNPKVAILMVSHCRIFPFITREILLSNNGITEISDHYICYSCFGAPDEHGFYKV